MLCCVGLIGGAAVGQAMGGPWTWVGPAAGFGIASGVMRMFGSKEKEKGEMTLAEIRKTYETGASEPPARG